MTKFRTLAACAAFLFAALGCGLALAQSNAARSVDQYSCKDVMREHGDNRDVTIAFLHGYLLGKSGSTAFDIDALHKQTSAFIEYCLDNPSEKAVTAMTGVKK
jgi:hypothetical protein